MGLPWIRLDTSLADHPKVLELASDREFQALSAHLLGMTYAGKHGTDGFIPATALPFIHARKRDADLLSKVGFWVPAPGGWDLHGWDEYQVSDDESKARRRKAQAAAAARWQKQKGQ